MKTIYRAAISEQGDIFRAGLIAHKNINKFEVGCYMIMKKSDWVYDSNGDYKIVWKVNTFGNQKMPRKYKIIAVDEFGIPFYRQVLYNGKLKDELKYMGNQDLRYTKFFVDPDMQDFILTGGDIKNYNSMMHYKKSKRQG